MLGGIRRLLESRRRGDKPRQEQQQDQALTGKLDTDIELLKTSLGESDDLIIRPFVTGGEGRKAVVLYFDGLVDMVTLQDHIIAPIVQFSNLAEGVGHWEADRHNLISYLRTHAISVGSLSDLDRIDQVADHVMMGRCAILVDGQRSALTANIAGGPQRAPQEPAAERTVRGPRDSFVENFATNIAMLRRSLRSPGIRVEVMTIGSRSKTRVAMVYYSNIAKDDLVAEVRRRLREIDVDRVIGAGWIEQQIEDNPWSPFPQILSSERPDKIAASITEGRVGLVIEGTPFALVVPSVFANFMHSPEDFYERWMIASVLRITRFVNVVLTVTLPAVYIAIVSYNPGLLPTQLMISITGSRVGNPFPAFYEALLMEVTLEFIQEAGIRLPQAVGQTVTFVGGLVIGQSAVQAGLVSPIMVIIISLTAITSFTIPNYSMNLSLRLLRVPMMIAASFMGLFGVVMALLALSVHLFSLKSFGIAYTSPLSPVKWKDWQDFIIRAPAEYLKTRPLFLKPKDIKRQGSSPLNQKGDDGDR